MRKVVAFCGMCRLCPGWRTTGPCKIHKLVRRFTVCSQSSCFALSSQSSSLMKSLLGVLKCAVGVLKGSVDVMERILVERHRAWQCCVSSSGSIGHGIEEVTKESG